MSEKPILFSGPMVRAILDGRKTQTRRIVKIRGETPPTWATFCAEGVSIGVTGNFPSGLFYWSEEQTEGQPLKPLRRWPMEKSGDHYWARPPYSVGDTLWVRETWRRVGDMPDSMCTGPHCAMFQATADEAELAIFKWKPSIFMPRWASRITLRVTAVRCERLQEISREDEIAEGVEDGQFFDSLWDSINAKRAPWSSNPWVWVYTFTRAEKPGFSDSKTGAN